MKEVKSTDKKGGYYTVEASIAVPLVIIAILTISAFGRAYGLFEHVAFAGVNAARGAMINSYVLGNDITLKSRALDHLKDEDLLGNVRVTSYKSGYAKGILDELISFKISYSLDIKAPLWKVKGMDKSESFLCRKFSGKSQAETPFTFERMEQEEEGKTVYLFPMDGTKFHSKDCSYVVPAAYEKALTVSLKGKYSPCSQCQASSLAVGQIVYIFPSYGDYYHRKDCQTVRKNVVKSSLTTALDKGYTPCSKCGGGQ